MKTIRNKTPRPLRVPLPGGKVLHLGPGKTGQVSDKALERPALRKLHEADEIEIVNGDGPTQAAAGSSAAAHRSTHGHRQSTVVTPKGDR